MIRRRFPVYLVLASLFDAIKITRGVKTTLKVTDAKDFSKMKFAFGGIELRGSSGPNWNGW